MSDACVRAVLWLGYRVLIAWAFFRRPHIRGAHVYVRHASAAGDPARVLLVRNSYKAGITLPCGGIKRGETPREAGARELAEETGIRVVPEALIEETVITLVASWRTDEAHFFRLDLPADANPTPRIDHREVIWAEFVDESTVDTLDVLPHLARYRAWRREVAGARATPD